MKTPEQEQELQEHKRVFGVSFFHKNENRVMHPKTIRFVFNENFMLECDDWSEGLKNRTMNEHRMLDVEIDKIEGYENIR